MRYKEEEIGDRGNKKSREMMIEKINKRKH